MKTLGRSDTYSKFDGHVLRISATISRYREHTRHGATAALRVNQFITRILYIIQTSHVRVSHGMASVSPWLFVSSMAHLVLFAISLISIGYPQHRGIILQACWLPTNAASNYRPYFTPTYFQRQILRARLIIMLNRLLAYRIASRATTRFRRIKSLFDFWSIVTRLLNCERNSNKHVDAFK